MSEDERLFELIDSAFIEPPPPLFMTSETAFSAMVEGIKIQNREALDMLAASGLPLP